MIFNLLSSILLLSSISFSIYSMQSAHLFKFVARVQNQSKNTISYIHAKGDFESDYKEDAQLAQNIPHDYNLEIVRGKGKSSDIWLEIGGEKHALSSIPTVFERIVSGSATKTLSKGYQIKFDGENVAQVIEGELVNIKIDEANKISFVVQRDYNYSLIADN